MSLAAITAVRPSLTMCFRSPLLADLNSSSRGRMSATSSEGKHPSVSSASDMLDTVTWEEADERIQGNSDSSRRCSYVTAAGRDS
jgi:hypothetical protein